MSAPQIQVIVDKRLESLPGETLLSSAFYPWSGFLMEHHRVSDPKQYYSLLQVRLPQIILVLEGEGEMQWYSESGYCKSVWKPGLVVFLNRDYEQKSLTYTGTPRSYLVIEISESLVANTQTDNSCELTLDLVHYAIGENLQAAALIRTMYDEILMGCPSGSLYAESLTVALAAHLSSYYAMCVSINSPRSRLSQAQINIIIDYIHENLGTHMTLEQLANTIGVTPFRLCKQFKEIMGITPYHYILEQRIERAKTILAEVGDVVSITDIALSLGFCSHSHFTAAFHKYSGISPREYRHQLRNSD